jgi:hypothetical protein
MGHGASVPSAACNHLFNNHSLVDGSKYICDDACFQASFVRYIQAGNWQDQVAKFVPKDVRLVISLDLLAREKVCLMNEYAVPRGRLSAVYGTKMNSFKSSHSDAGTVYSRTTDRSESCRDTVAEPVPGFSMAHTIAILFSVLYPMYVAHVDAEDMQSAGLSSASFDSYGALRFKNITSAPAPEYAQRTCETLLRCARSVTETAFEAELKKPTFNSCLLEGIDHHALAVTIVDATKDGFPIVYANQAFEQLSGLTLPKLLHKNLLVLSGPETEATQLALLHEAMSKSQSAKLGITCYKRGKHPFLNLIALRSCGRYSVAVHFPSVKEADLAQLSVSTHRCPICFYGLSDKFVLLLVAVV